MSAWPLHAAGYRLSDAPSMAGDAKVRSVESQLEMMRFDIERLLMVTEALWGILREKHGLTDEDLTRRIHEIDLRDGKLDGRVAPEPPGRCPRCDRVLERKRPYCLYCGQPIAADPFQR